MIYLVMLLTAASVALLVLAAANFAPSRPVAIERRLAALQAGNQQRSVIERRRRQARRERLEAVVEAMGRRMDRLAPRQDGLRLRLTRAGFRTPGAPYVFLGTQVLLAAGGALGISLLYALTEVRPSQALLGPAAALIGGWLFPTVWLSRRIRTRQKALQKALPDTLDLIVICVEAGLGLNQALARVSDEIASVSGEMSDELALVNLEIRTGTPRDEALRNLGHRSDVPDLRALVAMLIQTDRFGTSIANALRVQADTLRTKRRQRAEEAAAKTTIKMIVPLVLFIFPAMFVVILGPAVFHIIEMFRSAG